MYNIWYIVSYLAATATATATTATTATTTATTTAIAMAMAMLKMDVNVGLELNLGLEPHVKRALFYCIRFSSWLRFFIFFKILGSA